MGRRKTVRRSFVEGTGSRPTEWQNRLSTLVSVLDSSSEGVIVAGLDGEFLFFNPVAERILGLGLVDIPPAAWAETYGCFYPDQVTPFPSERLPLARALQGEEVLDQEIFIRNSNLPRGVFISVSGRPLRDENGNLFGGVVLIRDITERKRAQELVRLLSNAVEQTADSVLITDTSGTIQYVNPAFERTTGYHRDEIIGKKPSILKSGRHDREFYQDLWNTLLEGRVFRGILVNRKKAGDLYWAEQTITPMKEADGRISHFVSVLKDLTEIRRQHEQKAQMRLAREVQQRFYREEPPELDGFDIAASAEPAGETGGDYFDFVAMPGNSVGIAVGDVSGHGFGSALVMAETRAYLRSYAWKTRDVGAILASTNRVLTSDLHGGRYVTLMLVRLDPEEGSLVYSSAGHPSAYLMGASGKIRSILPSTDQPLGLFADLRFSSSPPIRLCKGDILILLTDGVADTRSRQGEDFGIERTLHLVRSIRHLSAPEICAGVQGNLREFAAGAPRVDDTTCVICKVTGDY